MVDDDIERVRTAAQTLCDPHGIRVVRVDVLSVGAGGGYAVSLRLPEGMSPESPVVRALVLQIEAITEVKRVWVELAAK
jgi:hypothetical protein